MRRSPRRFHRPESALGVSEARIGTSRVEEDGCNLVACNRVSCSRNVETCEEALINSIKTLSAYSLSGNAIPRASFRRSIRRRCVPRFPIVANFSVLKLLVNARFLPPPLPTCNRTNVSRPRRLSRTVVYANISEIVVIPRFSFKNNHVAQNTTRSISAIYILACANCR